MDYKLIKLKEGYIIVSNEEIENYYFNNHTKEIYLEINPKRLEVTNKELNKEIIFKIIASTFIPQLPNIDFNNLEEEFDIVDVPKLANKQFDEDTNKIPSPTPHWYDSQDIQFDSFIKGFNKCLSLNKDKLFTLEDLRIVFGLGAANNANGKPSFEDIIQSLQPKEWDIEIETEYIKDFYRDGFRGAGTIDIKQPKITNNKIKILKIK